jgi:hypothetical protein
MMRSIVLLADDFATAEAFTALRETLAGRVQVEFVRARALHTVVPRSVSRGGATLRNMTQKTMSR